MQITFKIYLVASVLIAGSRAETYPIPNCRLLIDAFSVACHNPSAAEEIHFEMIQRAISELRSLPIEAREQLDESPEGRLTLDFVINPAEMNLIDEKSDEEKQLFVWEAVDNFITFEPAYVERKLIHGQFPMPDHPWTRQFIDLVVAGHSRLINIVLLNRVDTEIKHIRKRWSVLREVSYLGEQHSGFDSMIGFLNFFNNPSVILLEKFILPILKTDEDIESKLFKVMQWVFSRPACPTPSSQGDSSSSGPARSRFNLVGIPPDSAINRLIYMATGVIQGRPTLMDLHIVKNEITRFHSLNSGRKRDSANSDPSELFRSNQAIRFLNDYLFPLMKRSKMGLKLGNLMKIMNDLEDCVTTR